MRVLVAFVLMAAACSSEPEAPAAAPQRVPLTLGSEHTCVVLPDGGVACWGGGHFGQMGHGALSDSPAPVRAVDVHGVGSIAGGWWHNCATDSSGAVTCWGRIGHGEDATSEALALRAPSLDGAIGIASAAHYTCALARGGVLQCLPPTTAFAPVPADVAEVVFDWGDTMCWRDQAGDTACRAGDVVTPVPRLFDARAVALRGDDLCILNGSGHVRCIPWRASPVRRVVEDAAALSTGSNAHACAIRADRSLVCWGSNSYGQLGDGTRTDSEGGRAVIGIDDAVAVATGSGHTCAVRDSGRVSCWGHNHRGQLGDGTTVDRLEPVDVVGIDLGAPDGGVGPESTWTGPALCLLQDADGDGLEDGEEGTTDWDEDGILSWQDPDSDGDGIPDADELDDSVACHTRSFSGELCDWDVRAAWEDTDSDDDGAGDAQERELGLDSCREDSDEDGCPDFAIALDGACRADTTYEIVSQEHQRERHLVLTATAAEPMARLHFGGTEADALGRYFSLHVTDVSPPATIDPKTGEVVGMSEGTEVSVLLLAQDYPGVESLQRLEGTIDLTGATRVPLASLRIVALLQPIEFICEVCTRPACNYRC